MAARLFSSVDIIIRSLGPIRRALPTRHRLARSTGCRSKLIKYEQLIVLRTTERVTTEVLIGSRRSGLQERENGTGPERENGTGPILLNWMAPPTSERSSPGRGILISAHLSRATRGTGAGKRDRSDIVKLDGPADVRAIFTRARHFDFGTPFAGDPWDGSGKAGGKGGGKRDGSDIVKLGGPADVRAIFTRARHFDFGPPLAGDPWDDRPSPRPNVSRFPSAIPAGQRGGLVARSGEALPVPARRRFD